MKRSYIAVVIGSACSGAVMAQEAAVQSTLMMNAITVTASREDRVLQELASNAAVIDKTHIAQQQGRTLADALHLEPGVSMDGTGRFGLDDVAIRGVSGNRVKVTYDGLPIADRFAFGPFQDSGRAYFDLNNTERVEIIRGPVSSLHGASALGGVVSVVSESPSAFVSPEKPFGGAVGAEYSGKNNGTGIGATAAFQSGEALSGLLNYHFTDSDELKNHGGAEVIGRERGVPDPMDNTTHSVNGKLIIDANPDHRFTLSGSYFKDQRESNLLGALGVSPAPAPGKFYHTYSDRADDEQSRQAISLTHDFTLPTALTDGGYWRVYAQKQESEQVTSRYRKTPFVPPMPGVSDKQRERKEASFATQDVGLDVQLDKYVDGNISQEWLYGLSYTHRDVSMKRYNRTVNDNGAVTEDKFEKNAPDTTVNELGVFVQNRINFADSGFSVIPGLRFDYYDLSPEEDAVYRQTVGARYKVRDYSENRLSTRLGVLYEIDDVHTLYANYSEGFRAPSFSETNLGFANERQGYSLVENPDLKPETSRGVELGWRMNNGVWSHTLSGFYTRYNNFIRTQAIKGFNPQTQLNEFHNVNLPSAEIYGVEWSSNFDISAGFGLADGLSVQSSLAYAEGEDRETGEPISSIEPLSAVVNLRYDDPSERWGGAVTVTAAKAKDKDGISSDERQDPRRSTSPVGGYGVIDLTGYYRPMDDLTLRAGVYNAFDKKYTPWSTAKTAGIDVDLNSAPGRWIGASIRYEF